MTPEKLNTLRRISTWAIVDRVPFDRAEMGRHLGEALAEIERLNTLISPPDDEGFRSCDSDGADVWVVP